VTSIVALRGICYIEPTALQCRHISLHQAVPVMARMLTRTPWYGCHLFAFHSKL